MRTFALLLLLTVACKGNHMVYRQLIDLLRRHEAIESLRHVSPVERHRQQGENYDSPAERHVTQGVRHVTQYERHYTHDDRHVTPDERHYTATDKHFTVDRRHDGTAVLRQVTLPSVYTEEPTTRPLPSYVHHMEENEFSGLEEAFLFPGSHYLIDMIRKHCESGMGLKMGIDEIREQFQLPECETKGLRGMLLVLKEVEDPQGVALLVTRTLIKPLLMERMKCPATILDMGIVKTLLRLKDKFMYKEDNSMFTFFVNLAPHIDSQLGQFADDIAAAGVHELHGVIFNETLEFLWKYGLKDLAYASHKIFHQLHFFFDDVVKDMDYLERVTEFKQQLLDASSIIRCPSSAEVIEYHKKEVLRFKNVFGVIETEQVCLKVADFITKYLSTKIPGYAPNFENNVHLSSLCEGVKLAVDDIVKLYADYENFLFSMEIEDLEVLLEEMLTQEEWALMEEVLRRLGFI